MNYFDRRILYRARQVLNHLSHIITPLQTLAKPFVYTGYVDKFDKDANDYLFNYLCENENNAVMIAKFGSIELDNIVAYRLNDSHLTYNSFKDLVIGNVSQNYEDNFQYLCSNAGFFPYDSSLAKGYYDRMCKDILQIDILCSYQYKERYVKDLMRDCKCRVNLDGFYSPFLWQRDGCKPWTSFLKGKRVLVIHPFVESIRYQYENNRDKLWDNPDVLPEFRELLTFKAVQSIADNKNLPYKDWFEALEYMEGEISKKNFDVALIGCGAYGMCLAAHVKRMGKIAIHLAGWTQFLFGVYGNIWTDQPKYAKFINKYWIRPNETERPAGFEKVEEGCYW